MADKTYNLNFELSDGTTKTVQFVAPQGEPGETPEITIHELNNGYQLVITIGGETKAFEVKNGKDGKDGVSPTIEIHDLEGLHQVVIYDAEDAPKVFEVKDGVDGEDGEDGITPVVEFPVYKIPGGHEVRFVVNGESVSSFQVMDGKDGENGKDGDGAGVTSWNDLDDRPFYNDEFEGYILPDGAPGWDVYKKCYVITEPLASGLIVGESYTVSANGLPWVYVAKEIEYNGVTYVGIDARNDAPDDYMGIRPFFLEVPEDMVESVGAYAIIPNTNYLDSISIYGKGRKLKKIDPDLLPDDIGGGASSWNNLKDKPFDYTVLTEGSVFPETTLPVDSDEGAAPILTPFAKTVVAGETYVVNWNGTNYECVAGDVTVEITMQYIGNIGAMGMGDDTGEPFCIMIVPDVYVESTGGMHGAAYALDGSAEVTFSIGTAELKKLDSKFLDLAWIPTAKAEVETEWIPEMATNGNSSIIIASSKIDPALFMQGKKMAMYIDGVRYESPISWVENFAFAGNMANIQMGVPDNGLPFAIMAGEEMTQVEIRPAAEKTFSVYVFTYGDNKVPYEFLPVSHIKRIVNEVIGKISTAEEASF